LDNTVRPRLPALPVDMSEFWNRVVERCQV
jgi:hypothetical protein